MRIATLRDFLEGGYEIHAYCEHSLKCRHSTKLDLAALAEWLGADFDLYQRRDELLDRLACEKCGARRPNLIFNAPTKSRGI